MKMKSVKPKAWMLAMMMSHAVALSTMAQVEVAKPYGYLYCHMSDDGEWTAFALSRDGVNWKDVNGGKAMYDTEALSRIEHGARDAYIARAHDGQSFVMVTTDMCWHNSGVWNNYGIDLLKSDDLVNWTSTTVDFRLGMEVFMDDGRPDVYRDYSKICRVWAPQVLWDPDYTWKNGERGGYFVYYSLLNSEEDTYDRIFYSYADRSFTRLTRPQLLIDWGYGGRQPLPYHDQERRGKTWHFHHLVEKPDGTLSRARRDGLREFRGEESLRGTIGLPAHRRLNLARGLCGVFIEPASLPHLQGR